MSTIGRRQSEGALRPRWPRRRDAPRFRSRVTPRLIVLAAFVLFTTGCDDEDSGGSGTDLEVVEDAGAAAEDGTEQLEDEEERQAPRSTLERETLETPRTEAEVRVGEIIIEFDGEVTDEGTLLTIEEPILFDFDSAELRDGSTEALDDITEVLEFYPQAPVRVLGHTDNVGSEAYNLDLSQHRADAVTAAFVERGIDPDRVSSEGRGLHEPVASNDTEEGRAQNRRVEVLIVGVEPPD